MGVYDIMKIWVVRGVNRTKQASWISAPVRSIPRRIGTDWVPHLKGVYKKESVKYKSCQLQI